MEANDLNNVIKIPGKAHGPYLLRELNEIKTTLIGRQTKSLIFNIEIKKQF